MKKLIKNTIIFGAGCLAGCIFVGMGYNFIIEDGEVIYENDDIKIIAENDYDSKNRNWKFAKVENK